MKFRSKNGSIHNTLIGAITSGATQKIENTVRSKLPGYKEAIDNDINISIEEEEFDHSSYEDEFFDEEDDEDCEHNGMILEGQYDNHTPEKIAARAEVIEHQDENEDQDIVPEEKDECKNHIEIDYSQNKLYLKDEENNILAESDIPELILTGIIDSKYLQSLYPDKNIPKDIKITTISLSEERKLQDKLNEMHITKLTAKDILHSSDPVALLRTYGVSKESIDIIMDEK